MCANYVQMARVCNRVRACRMRFPSRFIRIFFTLITVTKPYPSAFWLFVVNILETFSSILFFRMGVANNFVNNAFYVQNNNCPNATSTLGSILIVKFLCIVVWCTKNSPLPCAELWYRVWLARKYCMLSVNMYPGTNSLCLIRAKCFIDTNVKT